MDQGAVPPGRTRAFRRDAFEAIRDAYFGAEIGRSVVLLGQRGVGKSVLLHQLVEELRAAGAPPRQVLLVSLEDVAQRGAHLGAVLDLVAIRAPVPAGTERWLPLDEVERSPSWAGWLKRIADRRDPLRFFATGSSATAPQHGGQDAGLGRWREMTLYPWSFRELVRFRGDLPGPGVLSSLDDLVGNGTPIRSDEPLRWPPDLAAQLDEVLIDDLGLGGFPEGLKHRDPGEGRRHLRQDILDRALGRDVVDVESPNTRALDRLFLGTCQHPKQVWNASEVANDLGISRPTVAR